MSQHECHPISSPEPSPVKEHKDHSFTEKVERRYGAIEQKKFKWKIMREKNHQFVLAAGTGVHAMC